MKTRSISFFLLPALCVSIFSYAGTPSLKDLIQGLAGDDDKARVVARQMLPREDVSVVPMIVPLIEHENEAVWRATFNVLADFANEVSVPGREKEQIVVINALMALVAPEKPAEIKVRGLELLSLVVPEGYDISPVAALLEDLELRERARGALQVMGTKQACGALRSALSSSDPEFVPALIDALEKIGDEGSIPILTTLLSDEVPEIRSAAARALSHTGDARLIPAFRVVRQRATPGTEFEATNAFLMLGDSMREKGTNIDMARRVYSEVLKSSTHPALAGGALVGLGKAGGEHVVQQILGAIRGENGRDLEPAALAAFECLQGKSEREELATAFSSLPEDVKIPLLGVFGRTGDPVFLPPLAEMAKEGSSEARMEAHAALAATQLPEAVAILVAGAEAADTDTRESALCNLQALAASLGSQGKNQEAGEAFLSLYKAAEADDLRAQALDGIAQYPVPGAIDTILSSVGDTGIPVAALVPMAEKLKSAGYGEEADRLLATLLENANTTEAVQGILHLAGNSDLGTDLSKRLGFVTNWTLVGPFPWKAEEGFAKTAINEPAVDLDANYTIGGEEIAWQQFEAPDPNGLVNLDSIFGSHSSVTAYAHTEISLEEETEAVVLVGSDDGVKIWINGESVHENNADRGTALDQDRVPVKLNKGKNSLLVQITQGAGGWAFCLRLTGQDGTPLVCEN